LKTGTPPAQRVFALLDDFVAGEASRIQSRQQVSIGLRHLPETNAVFKIGSFGRCRNLPWAQGVASSNLAALTNRINEIGPNPRSLKNRV
jgi:hypothetical protein